MYFIIIIFMIATAAARIITTRDKNGKWRFMVIPATDGQNVDLSRRVGGHARNTRYAYRGNNYRDRRQWQ